MEKLFKLKEYHTNVRTEVMAGLTTFMAMSYIILVNPQILSEAGLPYYGVYVATILTAFVSTLVMALYANLPYALAPGMGLNSLFSYTVVLSGGFTPYESLAIVLVAGIINIIITLTGVRRIMIQSIPQSLQAAMGAGIGFFIAYTGLINVGLIEFGVVPQLGSFADPMALLFVIGLLITLALMLRGFNAAILLGMVATTLLAFPLGITSLAQLQEVPSFAEIFADFGTIFGKALGTEGVVSLFTQHSFFKVLPYLFTTALMSIFNAVGTLIGTGRRSGIFTEEDAHTMTTSSGINTRIEKGFAADLIGSLFASIFGVSTVASFVESSTGIEAGGRTGLTSLTTAFLFLASLIIAPIVGLIPTAATAPALIIVGILMSSAFADIDWQDFSETIPVFGMVLMMVLSYDIANGMAVGFILYTAVHLILGKQKELHPIVWGSALLFIINFFITRHI